MRLIKCRFLDASKEPRGREYTYGTNDDVCVGEVVRTEEGKELVVTTIDVPPEAGAGFKDKLKYVTTIQPTEPDDVIDGEAVEIDSKNEVMELPEISINEGNLAIVEQLPIITEQLKVFSVEIDQIVASVKLMECTEKNRQSVKRQRQKINKLRTEFEKRRIAIKNEIIAPYEKFNNDYKEYVDNKITEALQTLDKSIAAIESGITQRLQDDAESYFYEYLASKDIDWLTWKQSGIKVGLSDNKTSLRREVSQFIDRVSDDLIMIETQEHKSEIMVEYRKELNLAKSITTVQARVKAVAEQERVRAEQEERRKQQEEQRRLQAEALEKVRAEQQPHVLEPPKREGPTAEPITQTYLWSAPGQSPAPSPQPSPQPQTVKKYTVAFKINNETPERLALVKKFLLDNGFSYVQVPLKNIIESEAM